MTDSPKTTDSEDWEKVVYKLIVGHPDHNRPQVVIDYIKNSRTAARESALREALEVVKEHGHQQDDDTIWCNMDETYEAISTLLT